MLGDPRRNSAICFDTEKSRMMWLQDAEKKFENVLTRCDTIHERDGQTDGQTPHDGIGRAYRL